MRLLGRIGALMGGAAGLLAVTSANAQIPIEDLARTPAVTNVTMSSDGSYLVGLMTPPGDKGEELALAVWDLENSQGPVITPGNDRMRFIAAQALKADKLFAVGRQAWTGPAGPCGIDVFAPAEDLDNENPSLVALRKLTNRRTREGPTRAQDGVWAQPKAWSKAWPAKTDPRSP